MQTTNYLMFQLLTNSICCSLLHISVTQNKETEILSKLALIEVQQRHQTQLIQHILLALQKTDAIESCELPDNISLPVQTLGELNDVEKALDIEQNARKMVNILLLFCKHFSDVAI